MKRIVICVSLAICCKVMPGQSISPSVVNTAGGSGGNATLLMDWSIGESFVQTLSNTTLFTLGVLQPHSSATQGPLSVTGLQFQARRVSKNQVALDWKTIQEFDNLGFYIERKRENENDYIPVGFVGSRAPGGNSNSPLDYSKTDSNQFYGRTYYRLKQQDINGRFTYSVIRMVNGEADKTVTLKAWPIPAHGDLTIVMQGTEKGILQVFDMTGRLWQQLPVTENKEQKINQLAPGTYIIRLAGLKEVAQKIIIQ